ncbi:MAG: hypothetical protein OEO82_12370 [Gammaproteobacteria bacterium]|nr:hypothetical protein [Gammaproteobacteria bacterium]
MRELGGLFIYAAAIALALYTLSRRDATFRSGVQRALEQSLILLPRMIFALIAAGFIVRLIPTEIIVSYLGSEAGFRGILIGSLTGLIVPSGPAVAFAIAAAFALEGASVPALVAFLTGWSVFAAHRVIIFEIPLLGAHFLRLRMLSVMPLPIIAGTMALLVTGF